MFAKLKEKAKVVYYTLGFFIMGSLALIIFLLAPIILTILAVLVTLGVSFGLAKSYTEYKAEEDQEGD